MQQRLIQEEPLRSGRSRVIRYRTISGLLADYERHLSHGELFLNTRQPPHVGASVHVVLSLSRPAVRAHVDGRVVRVSPFGNGANEAPGVQVAISDDRFFRKLTDLVAGLRRFAARPMLLLPP